MNSKCRTLQLVISPNRYWILLAGLGCLLGLAGWLDYAGRRQKVVFHEWDCQRIEIGMTRAEVEKELGMPPGDYSTGGVVFFSTSLSDYGADAWTSDEGEIRIWFDNSDRVERCDFRTAIVWKRSWFQRLRGWFGI